MIEARSPIPHGFKVITNWIYDEERIICDQSKATMHFHPVTWCLLIRRTEGSDAALDQLRIFLHQKIDQRFNAIR